LSRFGKGRYVFYRLESVSFFHVLDGEGGMFETWKQATVGKSLSSRNFFRTILRAIELEKEFCENECRHSIVNGWLFRE
jgi:hypothetical protein